MHLLHPLDIPSIKRFTCMQTLSLMTVFRVAVGPAMALVSASEKFLTDLDTGISKRELSKLFNEQLRSLKNLRGYAAQLQLKIDEHWTESMPLSEGMVRVGLSSWVFDMLAHSMGNVFWGENGPFQDASFRQQLRYAPKTAWKLRPPLPVCILSLPYLQDLHPEFGSPAQSNLFSCSMSSPLSTRSCSTCARPSC